MLGKLMKYDLRATYKFVLPVLGGLLVLAGLVRLATELLDWESFSAVFGVMLIMLFVLSMFAAAVLIFVTAIIRFYRSMAGQEGYLTHTLPVSIHALVWSKCLSTVIWFAAYAVMFAGSLLILFMGADFFQSVMDTLKGLPELLQRIDFNSTLILSQVAAMLLLSPFTMMLTVYGCISIGQLWKRQKLLGAFLSYLAVSAVVQTLSSFCYIIMANSNAVSQTVNSQASIMLVPALVLEVLLGVAGYFVTTGLLSKKLNLE